MRGVLCTLLLIVSGGRCQCLYNTLAAAVTPAVGDGLNGCVAGGTVVDGGSCSLSRASHTCSTAVCTGITWNNPLCIGYCEFNSLVIAPATASGANCNAGGQVSDGQSCTITRTGYTCSTAVCTGITWNNPLCIGYCEFDSLVIAPATASGANCNAGGQVSDGQSCTITRTGYTCSTAVCTGITWNNPLCIGYCEFNSLVIAPATASGANCNAGGQVSDGQSCTITRTGYTCANAVCSGTTWNTPTCTGNPCNGVPSAVPTHTNSTNYAACNTLISGATCSTYICDIYYHPTPLMMLCDTSGNYDASVAPCDPNPCNGGPYGYPDEGYPIEYHQTTQTMQSGFEQGPPTPIASANWAGCNSLATGGVCDAASSGFTCSTGWTGIGSITLYCDGSGNFNASGLTCEPNTCQGGPVAGIASHATATDYTYCNSLWSGVICEQTEINLASQGYVCEPGYRPQGDFELLCEMGGTYDATGSDCAIQNCMQGPTPQTVPNNTVASAFAACNPMETGDVCTAGSWTCDAGYTPQGDITLLCEGYYNVTGAICVPNTCTTPNSGVPANTNAGQFSGCSGRTTGALCAAAGGYTCDAMFTPVGDITLICDASGNYDAIGSSCLRSPCDLGPNLPLADYTSLQSYGSCSILEDGDTCNTIICDSGYTLSGTLSMSCTNRRYDVTGISCDPNPCTGGPDPSTLPANSTAASFTSCNSGTTGVLCSGWTCDTGYVATTPFNLFCNSSNMYSVANARCVPESPCNRGAFHFPENATTGGRSNFVMCENLLSGDTCTSDMYTCDSGYRSTTDFVIECINGFFNTSEAVCEPNACSGMTAFPECTGFKTGDKCNITSCPMGYEASLQQGETLSCTENGTSVENITCLPAVCSSGPVFSSLPQYTSIDRFSSCNRLTTGDSCVFSCQTGFQSSGAFTLECVNGSYTIPNTVTCIEKQCTISSDCTGARYASGVRLDQITGECVCTCKNGFSGGRCGNCDAELFSGTDCDRCSTNAVGYPSCRLCSVSTDCNSNAASVIPVNGNCVCNCRDQWSSTSDCQTCPSPFGGLACNECDPSNYFTGYPNCNILCTDSSFCNSHGTAQQQQQSDSCSCSCSDNWSGDNCDVCPSIYHNVNQDTCNSCSSGGINYPLCRNCTTICNIDNTIQINNNATHCMCQCKERFTGQDCSECAERYAGSRCEICAAGFIGSNCESQCTIIAHCRGNAIRVTTDGNSCSCTCAGHWTGSDCSSCPERFGGVLCDQCSTQGTGYVNYPTCTPCSVGVHCSNRAATVHASLNQTMCICVSCDNNWSGSQCELCTEPYGGINCDECLPGYINYPTCIKCTSESHCNSRGSRLTADANQTKCICTECEQPFTGEGCNIQCDSSVHCSNHATAVVAQSTGCMCQCENGWEGDTCETPICLVSTHCGGTSHSSGVTVEDNTCRCQCLSPWSGSDCSTHQCTVADHCTSVSHASAVTEQNNNCICSCTPPWTGSSCSAHSCSIVEHCNSRASSAEPNLSTNQCECTCVPPWSGVDCSVRGCTVQDHCNGRAESVDLVGDSCMCVCISTYEGNQCQTAKIIEKTCSTTTDCNNHATSVQLVNNLCVCECIDPYAGTSCSIPICSVSSHCNGRGISSEFDQTLQRCTCVCNPPYEGNSCEDSKCTGVVCDSPPTSCQVSPGECNVFSLKCDYINKPSNVVCDLNSQSSGICISGRCVAEDEATCGNCAITTSCESISSCGTSSCEVNKLSNVECDDNLSFTSSDRCVNGVCIGTDIHCTETPQILHVVLNCNSASSFGQTCTVTAETGYTCQGTALCTRQSTPQYESNIQCVKQCRVSDIPKPYVAVCGGEFFSSECGVTCLGQGEPLFANCLQGVVDVPRPCENCLISTFDKLRSLASITCTDNNFQCTLRGLNGSIVCDSSSGSCSQLSGSTCSVSVSVGSELCSSYSLQNGNIALCNQQQNTICITPISGYRCSALEVTACQQLETIICEPLTCNEPNMRVVNMVCVDCPNGEIKNSVSTRPMDGDTSCDLESNWKQIKSRSDAVCNMIQSLLTIRISKNGWSEYARLSMRSLCEFIEGKVPPNEILYAPTQSGQWQQLQPSTSDTSSIGAMILPQNWLSYDPRSQTNSWSDNWVGTDSSVQFEYISENTPPPVKDVLRVLVSGLVANFRKQPFTSEIFRLLSASRSPTIKTVTILFVCPFNACPGRVCPGVAVQRLTSGCIRGDEVLDRDIQILQNSSSGVWIDFTLDTHEGTVNSREVATEVLKEKINAVQGIVNGGPGTPVFISPVTDEDLVMESPEAADTTATPVVASGSSDSFPVWLIVLIAGGSLLFVCLVCLIGYCCFRKKKPSEKDNTPKRLESIPSSTSFPSTAGPSISQTNEHKPVEQNPIAEAFPHQLSSEQQSQQPHLYY